MANSEDPTLMRVGEPWEGEVPHILGDGEELGYLINDASAIILDKTKANDGPVLRGGLKDLQALVDKYYETHGQKTNVDHEQGSSWAIIAKRTIKPGEELYMTYGAEFWLWQYRYAPIDEIDPFDRLVLYIHDIQSTVGLETRGMFLFLDDVGRPSLSSTGDNLNDKDCSGFLGSLGFGDGRGESTMEAAGVTLDMEACEVTRRLFLYAADPEAPIPPAPLSMEMVSTQGGSTRVCSVHARGTLPTVCLSHHAGTQGSSGARPVYQAADRRCE
jgi:hypothetical protein